MRQLITQLKNVLEAGPVRTGFAQQLEDPVMEGIDIVTAVRVHYNGGGGLERLSAYYQQRFTNAENCNFLAHNILTAFDDVKVVAAQIGLIGLQAPPITLLAGKLHEFEQGFADTLLARKGMKAKMATTYRTNQSKYLRQATSRAPTEG